MELVGVSTTFTPTVKHAERYVAMAFISIFPAMMATLLTGMDARVGAKLSQTMPAGEEIRLPRANAFMEVL